MRPRRQPLLSNKIAPPWMVTRNISAWKILRIVTARCGEMWTITTKLPNRHYATKEIFRNARYLYSTVDYDGDPNIYRWNYFYSPVQIGDETVGVRIAIRDIANPAERQIYRWGIKKDTSLGGAGRGANARISLDASSDMSTNSITNPDEIVKEDVADRTQAGHPLGQNGVDAGYEAQQEILADFCGEMLFRDTAALNELAQKNRNLFQRIWDWVKSLFTRYEGTAMEKELRNIEQRFAQVVQRANTESAALPGKKYSIDPNFERAFDRWDKISIGQKIRVGTTSKVLQSIGVDTKTIYWDTSKIKRIMS